MDKYCKIFKVADQGISKLGGGGKFYVHVYVYVCDLRYITGTVAVSIINSIFLTFLLLYMYIVASKLCLMLIINGFRRYAYACMATL